MKKTFFSLVVLAGALLLGACSPDAAVPSQSSPAGRAARLFPDYAGVTIPPNIAPLNFMVREGADHYVATLEGAGEQLCVGADADGKILVDTAEWRGLVQKARGGALSVTVYAQKDGLWTRYPAWQIHVAPEPIDNYLSYRLIEPGYELYRQIGLYQRNLTNYDERPIYENNRTPDKDNNHCVNCHNYQNYDTRRMLFHVRGQHGGTVIVRDGRAVKLALKSDSILSAAVYPSWHPTQNWLVFSTNITGQAFHTLDHQKIEVVDAGSDLIFYDVDRSELHNVLRTTDTLENFPCWTPDGRRVYYCAATVPGFSQVPATERERYIINHYDSLHYNLMCIDFDPRTRTFGRPQLVLDCAAMGKSASVPRVSPDGRYLLFTLADYGQFHIWHKSADLWVKDLQTGKVHSLEANSPDVDSYHTWSSNGRWIVFSSRRDDGSYTRPYIAYFDRQGRSRKAFLLPQADPEQNLLLQKSYNVPELTRTPVRIGAEELRRTVYGDAAPVH